MRRSLVPRLRREEMCPVSASFPSQGPGDASGIDGTGPTEGPGGTFGEYAAAWMPPAEGPQEATPGTHAGYASDYRPTGEASTPSVLASPPQAPQAAHARRTRGVAVVVAAIVVAAGVGIVAGNVMGTRRADAKYVPQLTSVQQHVTRLSDDLDAARSTVSSYEAADASASSEAADVPDLLGIAHTYFDPDADVTGSELAVEITITDADVYRDSVALSLYLSELGFSSAVLDRMSKTRALDGTLTAEGHKCNVSWTYHPDDGLQMVFEATPGS